ncbi:MAG TPA: hypothetical protein VF618_21915 [Thermoanaerobaculia bacterium]
MLDDDPHGLSLPVHVEQPFRAVYDVGIELQNDIAAHLESWPSDDAYDHRGDRLPPESSPSSPVCAIVLIGGLALSPQPSCHTPLTVATILRAC